MNGQDGSDLVDAAGYGFVTDSFTGLHLDRGPTEVMARGRALRRRRRATPALAGLGIVAASVSLSLTLGSSGAVSGTPLAHNGAIVNVDNAAFTVHTDAQSGMVTFSIRQWSDAGELQALLAKAGIHAVFWTTRAVEKTTATGTTYDEMVCKLPTGVHALNSSAVLPESSAGPDVMTIDPANMPPGSVLEFTYAQADNPPAGKTLGPTKNIGLSYGLLSADPGPTCNQEVGAVIGYPRK